MFICILVLAIGLVIFPHAPIKDYGGLYADKIGNGYSYAQFREFQKWEVTLFTVWSIGLLEAIVLLPFYDRKSQNWRFH
jgi:hypothetical protein